MENYRQRLEIEKQELNDRIDSLHSFITSDLYDDIDPVQMSLLNIQLEAMRTYSQTLVERIAWLENS